MKTPTTLLTAAMLVLSTFAIAVPASAQQAGPVGIECEDLHDDLERNKDCVSVDDGGACEEGSTCDDGVDEATRCLTDRAHCDASAGACGDDDVFVEVTVLGNSAQRCVRDDPAEALVDLVQDVVDSCTNLPPGGGEELIDECQL